jgi:hypothetical protein
LTPSVLDLAASPLSRCIPGSARRCTPSPLPASTSRLSLASRAHVNGPSGNIWPGRRGAQGPSSGGLPREIWHDQGVMRSVLGVALPSPASPPTVLPSAISGRGRTLCSCIKVCLPSRPPVLPSGNACFRLTLVASSSILLHYNDERSAQDCRGRTSDSKCRWRKEPPHSGHVGPIQNSDIQHLGFLAAFTAVSLPCSFRSSVKHNLTSQICSGNPSCHIFPWKWTGVHTE